MTIAVSCTCGKTLNVPDQYAGKRIKCTGCGEPVSVPDAASQPTATPASSAQGAVATCTCGAKLRVTPQIAGKKVRCPKCQSPLQMPGAGNASPTAPTSAAPTPAAPAPVAPVQPAPTPVVSAPVVDHRLWDEIAPVAPETPQYDEFLEEKGPSAPNELAANEAIGRVIRELHDGRSAEDIQLELERDGMKEADAERLISSLAREYEAAKGAGITRPLGATAPEIIGGLIATLSGCHLAYTFFQLRDFGFTVSFESLAAVYGTIWFVRTAMGFGIALGGISILVRREIGLAIGAISAYIFYALTAITFVIMIIYTVKFAAENPGAAGGLNLKMFFDMSPEMFETLGRYLVLDHVGAGIVIYLHLKHH